MELGDMLKGFKIAGSSVSDAESILKYATKSNTNHAASVAKMISNMFMGVKYGAGASDWIKYSSASKTLSNIAGKIAETKNLEEALKDTSLAAFADKPEYLKNLFTKAADLASTSASAGKEQFFSRFTNKAGEIGYWSMARAGARIAAPVLGMVAPFKMVEIAGHTMSMMTPQTPGSAAQVAGQQW